MSSPNLKEELEQHMARNDKPPMSDKIKQSLSSYVSVFKGYSPLASQDDNGPSTSSSWFQKEPENDCCPSLSRMQRIMAFVVCIGLGLTFFSLSTLYIPVLLFKARKFSLLFSLGSLFMIFSFGFLWGPMNHLKHLFSRERLIFTSSYFGTLVGTLYCAMIAKSTPLTVFFAVLQVIALLWFLFSYVPGGHTGLRFFTTLCASSVKNTVSRTLPV